MKLEERKAFSKLSRPSAGARASLPLWDSRSGLWCLLTHPGREQGAPRPHMAAPPGALKAAESTSQVLRMNAAMFGVGLHWEVGSHGVEMNLTFTHTRT